MADNYKMADLKFLEVIKSDNGIKMLKNVKMSQNNNDIDSNVEKRDAILCEELVQMLKSREEEIENLKFEHEKQCLNLQASLLKKFETENEALSESFLEKIQEERSKLEEERQIKFNEAIKQAVDQAVREKEFRIKSLEKEIDAFKLSENGKISESVAEIGGERKKKAITNNNNNNMDLKMKQYSEEVIIMDKEAERSGVGSKILLRKLIEESIKETMEDKTTIKESEQSLRGTISKSPIKESEQLFIGTISKSPIKESEQLFRGTISKSPIKESEQLLSGTISKSPIKESEQLFRGMISKSPIKESEQLLRGTISKSPIKESEQSFRGTVGKSSIKESEEQSLFRKTVGKSIYGSAKTIKGSKKRNGGSSRKGEIEVSTDENIEEKLIGGSDGLIAAAAVVGGGGSKIYNPDNEIVCGSENYNFLNRNEHEIRLLRTAREKISYHPMTKSLQQPFVNLDTAYKTDDILDEIFLNKLMAFGISDNRLLSYCLHNINFETCSVSNKILFEWIAGIGHYQAYLGMPQKYQHFLHSCSYTNFDIDGGESIKPAYLIGRVSGKELCKAKKDNNRFKVAVGMMFYRVEADLDKDFYQQRS